jgi:hypothetical protein
MATERAADLLERMLDRISRADHDWTMIAHEAAELALLTARMAARSAAEIDCDGRHAPPDRPATSAEDD